MKKLPLVQKIALFFTIFATSGCGPNTLQTNNLEEIIKDLYEIVSKQQEILKEQGSEITSLKDDLKRQGLICDQLKRNSDILRKTTLGLINLPTVSESVFVGVDTNYYHTIPCQTGSLLFSIKNIEPYLDGFRIFAKIGNPSLIWYNGITLTLRFSGADDQEGVREPMEIQLAKRFTPATWTDVTIDIPKTALEELNKMRIAATPKTIQFYNLAEMWAAWNRTQEP